MTFEKVFVSTIIYDTQNAKEVSYQAYWRKLGADVKHDSEQEFLKNISHVYMMIGSRESEYKSLSS